MICPDCGKTTNGNFCSNCGAQLRFNIRRYRVGDAFGDHGVAVTDCAPGEAPMRMQREEMARAGNVPSAPVRAAERSTPPTRKPPIPITRTEKIIGTCLIGLCALALTIGITLKIAGVAGRAAMVSAVPEEAILIGEVNNQDDFVYEAAPTPDVPTPQEDAQTPLPTEGQQESDDYYPFDSYDVESEPAYSGTRSAATEASIPIPLPTEEITPYEEFEETPEPKPTPTPARKSRTVWIPQNGTKYHYSPECSNMKSPNKVTIEDAKSMGYKPCSKCVG